MPAVCYKRLRYGQGKTWDAIISYDKYDDFISSEKPEYCVNHISCQYQFESNMYISSIGHDRSWPGRVVTFENNKDIMRLHYVTRGQVSFDDNIIEKGEFFFAIPGQNPVHELKFICEHSELYYIIIKGKGLAEFIIHNCFYKTQKGSFTPIMSEVVKLFDNMIYERHDNADMSIYIYGGVYQILAYQKFINMQLGAEEHKTTNPIAIQAMRIISDEFVGKLSVSDIARQLHICPDYLSRILRGEIGYSAQTIITQKRMKLAQRLLLEKPYKKLTEIAAICGYEDYVYFCKQFNKHNHMSPNAYRKQADSIIDINNT